ncbi:type II toxin-antitoxin system PemK/MazF family toxin [Citreicella sp. C3M06]|uniref:type II toxin-antitoxin system PemK/MazF family toxin n=1 Tax=Citreicella sp. C3M06 TaxID=2841564 RepID=UPI001C08FC2C|nr:type II toxin-antitoxin system PemK/MazF family toxin [Citreicella sp. C3M06]MBU2960269.1 type II toxin-antitoxin system PemK/MazF family toxin [Citreicella sp. C3M06]
MYHHHHPFCAAEGQTGLQRGDVVLFRFPLSEEDEEPGAPKRRPCLVLDTLTKGNERFVEIAYGTSAETRANRGYEVIVKQSTGRLTAGLSKPTRFVCARRIIVHVSHSGFHGRTKGPHILGRLDAPLLERMNAVRARIQAEADIAAYYREERRQEEQAREDRGFQ